MDIVTYAILLKKIKSALSGISTIKLGSDGVSIDIETNDGQTFNIPIPEATTTSDIISTVNAGAIKIGDKVKRGENLQRFAEQLLIDDLAPSIALNLSCSDGLPYNEFREKGTSIDITANAIVTKNTYDISKVEWLDGIVATESNVPVTGGTFTKNKTGVSDTIKITCKATDSNNTVGSSFKKVVFVDPVYMSLVDPSIDTTNITASDLTGNGTKILKDNNGFDCTVTANLEKVVFSYPKSWGKLKSILDSSNNFELLSAYEQTEVDITTIDGRTETYYVYIPVLESSVTDFVYRLTWV